MSQSHSVSGCCGLTNACHRLLADARYLHREFTGLKHVGAPTAMLEVIVQEKRVRAPSPAAIEAAAPQPQLQPPSASRFKGYLQRTNSKRTSLLSPPQEKPLPAPTPVVPSPDPLARRLSAALSSAARSEDVLAMAPSASASQLDLLPVATNGDGGAAADAGASSDVEGQALETSTQADSGALSPMAAPLHVTPSAPSASANEKPQPPVPANGNEVPNGHASGGEEPVA